MPSKSVHSTFPAVSGGGGGNVTVNTPSARWSEDATVDDSFSMLTRQNEDVSVDDILAFLLVTNPENANVDDAWSTFLLNAYAEGATVNDLAILRIVNVDVARSGTPDNDPMFDAWASQLAPDANFGNANLLVKKNTVAEFTERQGFLAIDLTNYGNFTAGGTGLTLSVTASTTLLALVQAVAWSATRHAAKPFTESTLTWNNRPAAGTAVTNGTINVAAAPARFNIVVPAANLAACLGQWLLFTFTVADVLDLGIDTATIVSRDQIADRPTYTIDFLQRGS